MFSVGVFLLITANRVLAHYAFSALIVNSTLTEKWQYIRLTTPTYPSYYQDTLQPALFPIAPLFDLSSPSIRCGLNGTISGVETQTADVVAGSEVGFAVYQGPLFNPVINHHGPAMAYLSQAFRDLETYAGDGEWFKIGYLGAADSTTWIASDAHQLNFTIPASTPPEKYLLRVEHLNLLDHLNSTQFYVNCAQINIIGQGGGTPGPLVRFPGAYNPTDAGILVPAESAFIVEWLKQFAIY
ncbi:hypothetical protein GQ43DRAFT_469035 [Delitschia confertaspora ATCC 74209]|uniref:lytic cellulose monooxygenase (C4-dehydrogenating) n=1 Tax=Delitschia confertaspora ATCC 74209 TaxID=1513339 RepID=A0A9P4JW06_9PLEO|nr:hypothetical protein GQ43DRAFT_469035 [Delitschia confertaspora ATCC 74209]